ncbi:MULTISPECIES: HAD family hydrolase [Clostridium]|uniref:HAD hydrolase, family IA n=1 Tax=Clostridium botulinum (strain Eklund 17B / Type B) TaxID=935198 RepID=B2TN29_CLOBB|nr:MULTISPECIES: HAD family hydrolase [Clostridium]ACD24990.1 HAD hydrolase, family IA [Clostridium botulinum B str. Eklund 17B (NRP)]MBN1037990.1 HAD family hydrolase [Clostridium botulinum]MBN1044690.1 HAD family hydrolase [Clostridium botulinum]MBN1051420.1 HAD family hydrolase [Clostridium botulinum]MBY6975111.1 HAD family hydrolase [Clostridium botulinum]
MNKKYDYIFMDLDGTITDPMIGITKSIQYSLKHFGINVEDINTLTKFIGPPLKDTFRLDYGFNEEETVIAMEKFRERFASIGLFENNVYEGMEDFLKLLKDSGKTLMVATSKPKFFAEKILDHFGLAKYFTFIGGSNMDETRSKKSEVIEYVLSENNITDLSSVVMIGDRKHDIMGAKEFEIDSIGVLYGYGNYDELKKADANYIVKDLNELLNILI